MDTVAEERLVQITAGPVDLEGNLSMPENAAGVVLFAHGSGSSRHSPRNRYVAQVLRQGGLATLLMDLLTAAEEREDARTARCELVCSAPARGQQQLWWRPPNARTQWARWSRVGDGLTWSSRY